MIEQFQYGNNIYEKIELNRVKWSALFKPYLFFESYKKKLSVGWHSCWWLASLEKLGGIPIKAADFDVPSLSAWKKMASFLEYRPSSIAAEAIFCAESEIPNISY